MEACPTCQTATCKKFGRTRDGHQRYRCRTCRKTFSERPERPLRDMRLPLDRALLCLNLLCEGPQRANWTLRGHLRRFTRLSNGFSRKKENLRAALALFFAYYNFVRMHKSIRMTPAMAAGIARKPWSLADLLAAAQSAGQTA